MTEVLFPFAEYWWFYAGFTLFVLFMLALDLGVFHRKAHAVSFKEAATSACPASWYAITFFSCSEIVRDFRAGPRSTFSIESIMSL